MLISMRLSLVAVVLVCLGSSHIQAEVSLNELTRAEKASGWQLLFDGKTTEGWRNYRKKSMGEGWAVQDGIIARVGKRAGDIMTEEQFEYFELALEYRISKGGNSGIMFRVTEEAGTPWQTGPEIQIQDNKDGHDPQKSGWLYQLYKPVKPAWLVRVQKEAGIKSAPLVDSTRPAGNWNHLYLRISPIQCEVVMNGVRYYQFKMGGEQWDERVAASKFAKFKGFGKSKKGHIALQDHGNAVAFRNIKLRVLNSDGSVPNPVDGDLGLAGVPAFPKLKWEGWAAEDKRGRIKPLRPVEIVGAGDGTNRLFVATQGGMVHSLKNSPDVTESNLVLDLREKVADYKKENEEGLLGLALHPDFKTSGAFFVYYTAVGKPRQSIVSRFTISKDNPNKADPKTEQIIMRIPQPFANHNGGSIAFGPDGYLYIGLGDGGARNDQLLNGQNLKTWLGSILRIDIDRSTAGKPYAIPADNPFVKRPGAQPEIFAYGLRNVWRLGFDKRSGTLWAADVGQELWEEVNIIQKGGNYGWSAREGSYPFGNRAKRKAATVEPVWEYDHQNGKSITGGTVYRGSKIPKLDGRYLYADYVTGRIWALQYDPKSKKVISNMAVATSGIPVLAFGQDDQGEVYYSIESAKGQSIYRFEQAGK